MGNKNTGIIILSAGNSSRLGKPKQILEYQGATLIEMAVKAALGVQCGPVYLILGAYQDQISKQIENLPVQILNNPDWEKGMGTSISLGIEAILKETDINQVIIMLSDQPFVDSHLLDQLIGKKQASSKGMIACSYQDTVGVPALFGSEYFLRLKQLEGHEGAKKILKAHPEDIGIISFDKGGVDIDTLKDFEALKRDDWKHFI